MKIYKLSQTSEKQKIPMGPSGMCYKNARKWAWEHDDGNTFVVHGKVTNIEGKTFDHAWAEQGNTVIDPTQGVSMAKEKFYKLVNAKPEARYTPEQATINTVRIGNWGPWTKEEIENRFIYRDDL